MSREHKEQTAEFICRTRKVLRQYDSLYRDKDLNENFRNTLLLNICFSMISVCKEEMTISRVPYESLFPKEDIYKEKWGISPDDVALPYKGSYKIADIVKGIRDCLNHNDFDFNHNGYRCSVPIEWIHFESKEFKAKFRIEDFRKFVEKIASCTESTMLETIMK